MTILESGKNGRAILEALASQSDITTHRFHGEIYPWSHLWVEETQPHGEATMSNLSSLADALISHGDLQTCHEAAQVLLNVEAAAAEPACFLVEFRDKRVPIMGKAAANDLARRTGGTVKPLGVIAGRC